jgi:hypothetical protein
MDSLMRRELAAGANRTILTQGTLSGKPIEDLCQEIAKEVHAVLLEANPSLTDRAAKTCSDLLSLFEPEREVAERYVPPEANLLRRDFD